WPGCYGHANPVQAHANISAAESAMPHGPVTVFKAWTEMVHRYLAMAVGVLIISLMVLAWRRWWKSDRKDRRLSPWLATFLFGFVCLQGAFGAWTVTLKLQPVIVTLHLLFGLILLALLAWLAARYVHHTPVGTQAKSLRRPAALALFVLTIQIALGGWVSTNYAALACSDFPLCHGLWLPQMDFANGFTLWRHLGKTADGAFLPFPALTAIHWTHRLFALFAVLVVGWVAYKALRVPGLQKTARWLLVMLLVQFLIGVATVFLRWPLSLAVAHNGGAALLVLLLTMLNYKARLTPVAADKSSATAQRPPYEFIT
ncbi:MAG: COX15/CtaA family protein, partial [Proteobacteria bacterium]|nr:COX15/CtaA family protein [Pseudomonadota bacterium]